jgi:type VI secretion system secreted protein VgrG
VKKSRFPILVVLALAGFLPQSKADFILGSAEGFAVMGASTVTSTGNTVLNGNLGLSPGTSITGFGPPGIVNGTTYIADGVAAKAQADALTAYNALSSETTTENLTGQDLGGLTLDANGVWTFDSSAQLTGTLILDAQGNSDATFVFKIGSTLTTASDASVILINGAQADNVFWQVGSSATLGTGTAFDGTILANQSITLNTGANVDGRVLALNAAVTLDDNNITIPAETSAPEPSCFWASALCVCGFGAWRRMRASVRTASR